jgi:hypothetical protein
MPGPTPLCLLLAAAAAWALDIPEDGVHIPDVPGKLWTEMSTDVHLLDLSELGSAVVVIRYPLAEADQKREALFASAADDGERIWAGLRGPVAGEAGVFSGRAWRGTVQLSTGPMQHDVVQVDIGGGRGMLVATSLDPRLSQADRATVVGVAAGIRRLGAAPAPAPAAAGVDRWVQVASTPVSVPVLPGWRVTRQDAEQLELENSAAVTSVQFASIPGLGAEEAMRLAESSFRSRYQDVGVSDPQDFEMGPFQARSRVLDGVVDGDRHRMFAFVLEPGTPDAVMGLWAGPSSGEPGHDQAAEAGAALLAQVQRHGTAAPAAASPGEVAISDGRIRVVVPDGFRVEPQEDDKLKLVHDGLNVQVVVDTLVLDTPPTDAALAEAVSVMREGIDEAVAGVQWPTPDTFDTAVGRMSMVVAPVEDDGNRIVVVLAGVSLTGQRDLVFARVFMADGSDAHFEAATSALAGILPGAAAPAPPPATPSLRELLGH